MKCFRKIMLAFAAVMAVAAPASAGMQIINGKTPGSVPGTNDFGGNLLSLGLDRLFNDGADIKALTDGAILFRYHAAESGFTDRFETGSALLMSGVSSKTENNDAWVASPTFFARISIAAGQTFSSLGIGFQSLNVTAAQNLASGRADTAGFGVFYNSSETLVDQGTGGPYTISGPLSKLYFGFDDQPNNPDDNHDDMIVSAEFIAGAGIHGGPLPEPASLAMWGIGALGVVFAGRRRRQMKLAA